MNFRKVFYDVKLYDETRDWETIRELGYVQAYALDAALKRLRVAHLVKRFRVTEDGSVLDGYGWD
jgi:hypothetical protein